MADLRVSVLVWSDILALYVIYITMTYLTNVWKLGFTHAAAVLNVFWGAVQILPILLAFIADTIIGHAYMLLISSTIFTAGLGLMSLSTTPVLAHSTASFYAALACIAVGISGRRSSLEVFSDTQCEQEVVDLLQCPNEERAIRRVNRRYYFSTCAVFIITCAAVLGLPYMKPWSLRFGIPAISSLLATLVFLCGSYKTVPQEESPLTMFARVFVAAFSKFFLPNVGDDAKELYEIQEGLDRAHPPYLIPHTRSLRFLDKASIVVPTKPLEEQRKNRWKLCRVTEVEETKHTLRMIPVWMTFILCGVVYAIGFTYFVEQLNHLNPKVGRLKLPIVVMFWFHEQSWDKFEKIHSFVANCLDAFGLRRFSPTLGLSMSMILAILCCITAAKVEHRRLGLVDETVPMTMTMFWLLPQFILLGGFYGVFRYNAVRLFVEQSPVATTTYIPLFVDGVAGLGVIGSIVSVYVVGNVSERGGGMSWFQHDLNGSRLDKYYWTLASLMAANLVVFIVVATLYRHKESRLSDEEGV